MIPALLEGDTDVPIVERLLEFVGLQLGTVYGLRGKNWIDARLRNYNRAALYGRWFVLRDLNGDADCAPSLIRTVLPEPATGMCFRVAVRTAESWLLADRQSAAKFLGVGVSTIPNEPDSLPNPKQTLVNLARRSRRRAIREDMVPVRGTSSRVGPGYSSRIIEFATNLWRPGIAVERSPSLSRCVAALQRWAGT